MADSVTASSGRSLAVLIVAVPYSENLGDQVIAQCTEHCVRELFPAATVTFLDLSGRQSAGEASRYRTSFATRVFFRTPIAFRPLVVAGTLIPQILLRSRKRWADRIAEADIILVGGGQLLQDVYLNFPIKLWGFTSLVRAAGKRYSLFAVGVDPRVSKGGRLLFERVLHPERLKSASCRDEYSLSALAELSGGKAVATLSPDPALHAPQVYPAAVPQAGLVGLNIASPSELATSAERADLFGANVFLELWDKVISHLTASGLQVLLFTNGSRIDQEFAEQIAKRAKAQIEAGQLQLASRPRTAAELAGIVSGCETIVAHRLHACILAVAYRRRIVPLAWDRKVRSFFDLLGQPDACLEPHEASADAIAARVFASGPGIPYDAIVDARARTLTALAVALRES